MINLAGLWLEYGGDQKIIGSNPAQGRSFFLLFAVFVYLSGSLDELGNGQTEHYMGGIS